MLQSRDYGVAQGPVQLLVHDYCCSCCVPSVAPAEQGGAVWHVHDAQGQLVQLHLSPQCPRRWGAWQLAKLRREGCTWEGRAQRGTKLGCTALPWRHAARLLPR